MTCEISGCKAEAEARWTWGGQDKSRVQKGALCQDHGKELWKKLESLLQLNICWLILEKP